MRLLVPIILSLLTIACNKTGGDISRFHEDGRSKPTVAVASLIDSTSLDVPWSISEELTSLILNRLVQDRSIYAVAREDLAYTDSPFSADLSWVKRQFHEDEFVVFLELVEHDNNQTSKGKKSDVAIPFESATNLNMALKIRVIDLRGPSPKIVLQQILKDSYYIPHTDIPVNYAVDVWGSMEYNKSPYGIAHTRLAQNASQRIIEYVQLAKSR